MPSNIITPLTLSALLLSPLRALAEPPTPTPEEHLAPAPLADTLDSPAELKADKERCAQRSGRWSVEDKLQGCRAQNKREGRWRFQESPTGPIRGVIHFEGDALHGLYTELGERGRGVRQGTYERGKKQGLWREWFPGGQVRSISYYRDDTQHGRSFSWYPTCLPREWGAYEEGAPHGDWRTWQPTGARNDEGAYERGVRVGTWAFYHEEGNKIREGQMVNGLEEGEWQEWLHTGQEWRKINFIAGQRQGEDERACAALGGVWTIDYKERVESCQHNERAVIAERTYYESGALKRRSAYTQEGAHTGTDRLYHPTGELLSEGEYQDGVPNKRHAFLKPSGELIGESHILLGTGDWTSYHPNGAVEEQGRYANGVKVGRWRTFFPHAQARAGAEADPAAAPVGLKEEVTYNDQGSREGPYRSLYEDGTRSVEGDFAQNDRSGTWRFHYTNGQVAIEANFMNGLRMGPWREWHWLASPRVEGAFELGRQSGVWREYHNNGKLKAEGSYSRGEKEGPWALTWYSGAPWRTVNYSNGVPDDPEALTCEELSGEWKEDLEGRKAGCDVCRLTAEGYPKKLKVGLWRWWHPTGALEGEGRYEEGQPHGLWRQFDDEGHLTLEGRYEAGRRVGVWRGFYPTGMPQYDGSFEPTPAQGPSAPALASATPTTPATPEAETDQGEGEEGSGQGGIATGVWYTYHPSGRLESAGVYASGERAGAWVWLHDGGAVAQVGRYKGGRRAGVWVSYYPNGTPREVGAYEGGERVGEWRWWRESGEGWRAQRYGEGKRREALPAPAPLSQEVLARLTALRAQASAALPAGVGAVEGERRVFLGEGLEGLESLSVVSEAPPSGAPSPPYPAGTQMKEREAER
jgi:antitoxin component YwqK of YwqJK toxin-antitoxin module